MDSCMRSREVPVIRRLPKERASHRIVISLYQSDQIQSVFFFPFNTNDNYLATSAFSTISRNQILINLGGDNVVVIYTL